MKILLDGSPAKIREWSEQYDYEFWQLRTPLTRHRLCGRPYGLDNGCFSEFNEAGWRRMLREAEAHRPIFVCAPDAVGDARRTMELFDAYSELLAGHPIALVLQDGVEYMAIPWHRIRAVFVGGDGRFQAISQYAEYLHNGTAPA